MINTFVCRWIKELENVVNQNCPVIQPSSLIDIAKNTVKMLLDS